MSQEENETLLIGGQNNLQADIANAANTTQPKAKLVCLDTSMLPDELENLEIILDTVQQTIGRNDDNTVTINFSKISRHHALIYPQQGKWIIEDLNSSNGITVNDTRTKESILRSGDNVKIGSIPFLFTLLRPEGVETSINTIKRPENTEDDDSEKTMFFGGIGNSTEKIVDTLTKAEELQEANKAKEQQQNIEKRLESSKKKPGMMVFLILVLLLTVGGYFAYPMLMSPDGSEAVIKHRKAVKLFTEEYEMARGTINQENLQSQLAKLSNIRTALERAAKPFPNNQSFKELLMRVIFFQVERQLALQTLKGGVEKVISPLDVAIRMVYFLATNETYKGNGDLAVMSPNRSEIKAMRLQVVNSTAIEDKEFKKQVLDMLDILTFTNDVVYIKHFRQKYPDVYVQSEQRPGESELLDLSTVKDRFIDQKKSPNINIIMSVQFPVFGNIVSQVDKEDIQFIDQW
ncbi:MAG: FHA domain-containing protein [Magnetococcales bacterium]|nr:FHA domain-containing protein [Magnetococcales bacterium]